MQEDSNKFQNAIKLTEKLRSDLGMENLKNNEATILKYYSKLISMADNKELKNNEAAFLIADTMWYPVVDKNPDLEAIAADAGELELPDNAIDGDPKERWERLKSWIEEEKKKQT